MPWPFLLPEVITGKLSFTLSLCKIAADCFPYIVTDKVVTYDYSTRGAYTYRASKVCVKNIIVRHWVHELVINSRLKM